MIERSRSARTLVGAMLVVAGLASMASAQSAATSVTHLSLEGVVDPFVADYLRSGIDGADDAEAVLLTIDTPGGLDSSMREIVKAIQASHDAGGLLCGSGRGPCGLGGRVHPDVVPRGGDGARHQRRRVDARSGSAGSRSPRRSRKTRPRTCGRSRSSEGRNAELASTFVTESNSISAEDALEGDVIDLIAPSRAGAPG